MYRRTSASNHLVIGRVIICPYISKSAIVINDGVYVHHMGILDRFFRSKTKEVEIDEPRLSISELIESAENGDPEAQFELGGAYHNGAGVPQSYADAFKWFKMLLHEHRLLILAKQ